MTKLTVDDALSYVSEHREEIMQSLLDCDEVPFMMKSQPLIKKIWQAGCWLNRILKDNGASEKENEEICFAHGQRCFGNDPFEQAVRLANEFIATGTTKDRPGSALAEEIYNDTMGKVKDD